MDIYSEKKECENHSPHAQTTGRAAFVKLKSIPFPISPNNVHSSTSKTYNLKFQQ